MYFILEYFHICLCWFHWTNFFRDFLCNTRQKKLLVKKANLNPASIFNTTKIYRHHVFSIIVNIVCFIVLTAIDIYRINESAENYLVPIIYLIVKTFSAILYSAENVIGKIHFYIISYQLLNY